MTPLNIKCHSFICDGTDENLILADAKYFFGIDVFSLNDAPVYAKVYSKTTAPTEADTPIHRTGCPANSTAANGAGSNKGPWYHYISVNGIGIRVVKGIADNNDTASDASEVIVNVYYA